MHEDERFFAAMNICHCCCRPVVAPAKAHEHCDIYQRSVAEPASMRWRRECEALNATKDR